MDPRQLPSSAKFAKQVGFRTSLPKMRVPAAQLDFLKATKLRHLAIRALKTHMQKMMVPLFAKRASLGLWPFVRNRSSVCHVRRGNLPMLPKAAWNVQV